jgi:hypothetical protein
MSTTHLPPQLDAEAFRRKIAGLACSDDATQYDSAQFRAAAVDLARILCRLFGESLDRITLWDRISTALGSACSRYPNGEGEAFLSAALDHVKADPGATTREPMVAMWLTSIDAQPDAWRRQFVTYIGTRLYAVLVHARNAWEESKEAKRKPEPVSVSQDLFGKEATNAN